MQQHNMKEENILYPMCDNALGSSDVGQALAARLKAP
jgi:iron-sulfur cluster repair protein YtfE (RIC family)